jgi:carbonic anhydrase
MNKNAMSADEALRMLKEGNERFVEGRTEGPNRCHERRKLTSREGQNPFAAVLACADSRVPVKILFDRGVGDIFTVRVAGNVAGEGITGSLEYAVGHLGVRLLVVLGHSSCGAVEAALSEGTHSACVSKILEKITPALAKTLGGNVRLTGKELADEVARNNVWHQAEDIYSSNQTIRDAVDSGHLTIMAAFYDLTTGRVEWMGQYPKSHKTMMTPQTRKHGSEQLLST